MSKHGVQAQSRQPTLVLPEAWQMTFVLVTILGWLASVELSVGNIPLAALRGGLSVWVLQASRWLLTLVFFGLSLAYAWPKYRTLLAKLFMACLLSTIGLTIFSVLAGAEAMTRHRFYPPPPLSGGHHNYWALFGHQWLIMAIGALLFAAGLSLIAYKNARRRP
jgi:hypothetical protein